MVRRSLLFTAVILAISFFCIHDAWNNAARPPAGYTGAPGETTCANISCHGGSPITGSSGLSIQLVGSPACYTINQQYSIVVNFSVNSNRRGFELTAVDASGNAVGTLAIINPINTHTTISTGANGRQYVGHDTTGSAAAWAFKWTAPSAYVGPVTFYVAALAANGDGLVTGDQTYYGSLQFAACGTASTAVANFTATPNPVCLNDTVLFTNTSTGTISSYSWDFGNGASPATSTTIGPHKVVYGSTGAKTAKLTVTDGSGQTNVKTVTVNVVAPPTAAINASTQTVCSGGAVTLTASGGSHYHWSNGDTTAVIMVHPTQNTTYNVTVSNSPTCFSTASKAITVGAGPTAYAGPDKSSCFGDTVRITATGGLHYQWSSGDTTATLAGVPPTVGVFTLRVTVTDGSGCTGTDTVQVTVNAKPTVNIPDQSVCGTSSVTLDAGNAGARFHWSNNDTTQTTHVSTGGRYTVTVTNSAGCSTVGGANVTISASLPIALHDTSACQGQTIVLDAGYPGGTHLWSNGDTTRTISVTGPDTYSVTVTNSGCSGSDTAVVTFNPAPTANAGNDVSFCAGDSAIIGSNPVNGVTYSWSPTNGLFSSQSSITYAKPSQTTVYVVTASQNGCSATSSVEVAVNPLPVVSFSGLTSNYCVDDNTDYNVTGSPSGGVLTGDGTSNNLILLIPNQSAFSDGTFNPSQAGVGVHAIVYSYTDNNGCTANDTQYVTVHALPTPTISGLPTRMCIHDAPVTLTLTPTGGALSGPGTSGNTFDPSIAGGGTSTLYYDYTDTYGCEGSTSADVDVIDVPVTSSGIQGSYCSNDNTNYQLSGTPVNGTFSGLGVSGRQFNPQNAGAGAVDVTYSYDSLGCTFTHVLSVNINGIQVNVRDTFVCLGASITLSATGGNSYLWSTGETTSTITVSPTDTTVYTVAGPAPGCGSTSDAVTVNVIPALPVTFAGLSASFCSNDTAVALVGSPTGGVFSGDGLNGNVFDPTTAPIGGPYPIKYTYINTYGCVDSAKQYVSVVLAPTATIPSLDTSYCLDALPVDLVGVPANGFYSGPGISNNTFIPYFAGLGVHTIKYKSPQPTGCAASVAVQVTVHSLPTVALDPLAAAFCTNSDTVVLVGTPAGGTFSGPGVTQNVFAPAGLPVGGPVIVRYTYVDTFGCANSAIALSEINALPALQLVGVPVSYCSNQSPAILNGYPAGGTFSGLGVTGNEYHPDVAGTGNQTIVYSYTNNIGCHDSLITAVTVHPAPTANITNLDTSYCLNLGSIRLDATPQGGVFSGVGIVGNVFDPYTAGTGGPYDIHYVYTDGFGCADTFNQQVRINRIENLTITGLKPTYCINEFWAHPIHIEPSGGILIGAGIQDTSFIPRNAGLGTHILTYAYTNSNGCTSFAFDSVTVNDCISGIGQVTDVQSVKVYPNPTDGLLNIELNGYENTDATVSIYNIQGVLVYTSKVSNIPSGSTQAIELKGMAQGMYLLKVESSISSKMERIVIQ